MRNNAQSIQNFVYFCMNYPYDFIKKCWEGEDWLIEHLESKFKMFYDQVGPCGVVPEFFCHLTVSHQIKLAEWIDNNTDFCNHGGKAQG